jgi:hypothetical protein
VLSSSTPTSSSSCAAACTWSSAALVRSAATAIASTSRLGMACFSTSLPPRGRLGGQHLLVRALRLALDHAPDGFACECHGTGCMAETFAPKLCLCPALLLQVLSVKSSASEALPPPSNATA